MNPIPAGRPDRRHPANLARPRPAAPETHRSGRQRGLPTGTGVAGFLAGLSPEHLAAHRGLAAAALRHLPDAAPHEQQQWARYAWQALRQWCGPLHPATLHAQAAYGAVLCAHGHTSAAVGVFTAHLTDTERAGIPALLLDAHRYLADALHADRQCTAAHHRARHGLHRWHAVPGHRDHGTALLAGYAAILTGCGHTPAAVALLHRHRELLPHTTEDLARIVDLFLTAEQHHRVGCTARAASARRAPTERPEPAELADRADGWREALLQLSRPPESVPQGRPLSAWPPASSPTRLSGPGRSQREEIR